MDSDDDIEMVWIPLNTEDVPALERMLAEADPFVMTMIDAREPYRLADYVQNALFGEHEVRALLDRNLLSRAVALAGGEEVDHGRQGSEEYRLAAACMAHLITAPVTLEPNIALYEFASFELEAARRQTRGWRIADHVHPQAYLDLALGRVGSIDPVALREARRLVAKLPPESPPLETKLRYFRRHYCALMEVARLDRTALRPSEKLHRLIDWSMDAGFFDGLAVAFAIVFFGRHRAGRMMKHVRSPSKDRCLAGVRNAAWDLTYLSCWVKYASDAKPYLWIFATGDRVLSRVARAAVGGEERSALELLRENWPRGEAQALFAHYADAWKRAQTSSERDAELRERFERLDVLVAEIEEEIERTCEQS